MNIAVLIKAVPDTWGDRTIDLESKRVDRGEDPVIDEINEKAVEAALVIKEANRGSVVTVVSMGPSAASDAIRKALAMGADLAIHVSDEELAGSDAVQTSAALAAALAPRNFDLVIAGSESTDGRTGAIPAMIAERLGFAQLTSVHTLAVDGAQVSGERTTATSHVGLRATLPAVVSVTEQIAEARFPSFKGLMAAKKKPLTVVGREDLGISRVDAGGDCSWSTVETVTPRRARTAGRVIRDDGSAGREVADFLAAAKLI